MRPWRDARYQLDHGDKKHLRDTWKSLGRHAKQKFMEEYNATGGEGVGVCRSAKNLGGRVGCRKSVKRKDFTQACNLNQTFLTRKTLNQHVHKSAVWGAGSWETLECRKTEEKRTESQKWKKLPFMTEDQLAVAHGYNSAAPDHPMSVRAEARAQATVKACLRLGKEWHMVRGKGCGCIDSPADPGVGFHLLLYPDWSTCVCVCVQVWNPPKRTESTVFKRFRAHTNYFHQTFPRHSCTP